MTPRSGSSTPSRRGETAPPATRRRVHELQEAAEIALKTGAPLYAEELRMAAQRDIDTSAADALRLQGLTHLQLARSNQAVPLLLAAAALYLGEGETAAARDCLLAGYTAEMLSPWLEAAGLRVELAAMATRLPRCAQPTSPDLLLTGYSIRAGHGYESAVPALRDAMISMRERDLIDGPVSPWLMHGMVAAWELWESETFGYLADHGAYTARTAGDLQSLRMALHGLGSWATCAGQFDQAEAHYAEFVAVCKQMAGPNRFTPSDVLLRAWQGQEDAVREALTDLGAAPPGHEVGGLQTQMVRSGAVLVDLSLGRYAAALALARVILEEDPPYYGNSVLPDLVEAGVRTGDQATAQVALDRLTRRACASGTPWALGLLARAQALMANEDEAEPFYRDSIDLLSRTRIRTDEARSRLLYGEWLRRRRRRTDAGEELQAAHDMFQAMGAPVFARRARRELEASTGAPVRQGVPVAAELTAQESAVADLAAAGVTNSEIAARLFISPSTVEYHLRKVFRKRGITSRRQL